MAAWIAKNAGWIALAIVLVAISVRVFYAYVCYLNPDEAGHFAAARHSSWHGAYDGSLQVTHPPLFILVLHAFLFFGRSEFLLRFPSLICGIIALGITLIWLRSSFGPIAALSGLTFMAMSPLAISASTEVRQYGLLLALVCAALYATEKMFGEGSYKWALAQGAFLTAALLTHYIALLVIAVVGLYSAVRLVRERIPRHVIVAFFAAQIALAGVFVFLYFSQLRTIMIPDATATMSYLNHLYYLKGQESPIAFAGRMISWTFGFAIGMRRLALIPLALFLAGLAAIATGHTKAPRIAALLIALPFIIGPIAGALHVFPFAGSRHQAYLLPFLAAAFAASLTWFQLRAQAALFLSAAAIVLPLWLFRAKPDNNGEILGKADMQEAMQYVHQHIPPGSALIADYQSRLELEYYLARNDHTVDQIKKKPTDETLGGYRVVVPENFVWHFQPDQVFDQVERAANSANLPSGQPRWVFSSDWLDVPLASQLAQETGCDVREFGRISLIEVNEGCEVQAAERIAYPEFSSAAR